MRKFWISLLIGLLLVSPVGATVPEETIQITATAATSDQASSRIFRPLWATGIIVIINVTAGSTLSLDMDLQYYSPTLGAWYDWAVDCPSSGGITGPTTEDCFYGTDGTTASGHYAIVDFIIDLPQVFRILVDHGNANEATYTVRTQWVKR